MMTLPHPTVGELLRAHRMRRRMSQLELAHAAEISQRHLSFLESGRSLPSREMLLRLARTLDVAARERNALFTAAGLAAVHRERPLSDPALAAARAAVELVLRAYEPFPALAIDRRWTLLAANRGIARLLVGCDPALLAPPVNVLRLSLHPRGVAPRIVNLAAWREHVMARLARQLETQPDAELRLLIDELATYPVPPSQERAEELGAIAVPLTFRDDEAGVLSFLSTTTVFGTPLEVTLAELAIEAFLPADEATARALRGSDPA
jgi:transcriptional regulator with XRE-family HTH domain